MDKNDPKTLLVTFLRILADNIEQERIGPEQLCQVGEFFMSFLFEQETTEINTNQEIKAEKQIENQIENQTGNQTGNQTEDEDSFSEKDFLKFLTMGWYVYCQILEGKTL